MKTPEISRVNAIQKSGFLYQQYTVYFELYSLYSITSVTLLLLHFLYTALFRYTFSKPCCFSQCLQVFKKKHEKRRVELCSHLHVLLLYIYSVAKSETHVHETPIHTTTPEIVQACPARGRGSNNWRHGAEIAQPLPFERATPKATIKKKVSKLSRMRREIGRLFPQISRSTTSTRLMPANTNTCRCGPPGWASKQFYVFVWILC